MDVTIFHNPRCSKSRAALALLESHGITPRVVRYLETPPSAEALRELLGQLGIPARELLRTKEAPYAELGLGDPSLTEDRLIEAIAAHPVLMERPVVRRGGRAVIGRPPEKVLELL